MRYGRIRVVSLYVEIEASRWRKYYGTLKFVCSLTSGHERICSLEYRRRVDCVQSFNDEPVVGLQVVCPVLDGRWPACPFHLHGHQIGAVVHDLARKSDVLTFHSATVCNARDYYWFRGCNMRMIPQYCCLTGVMTKSNVSKIF